MAITNHERIGKALDLLKTGLGPFVDREIHAAVKAGAVRMDTIRRFAEDPMLAEKPVSQWDAAGLLNLCGSAGTTYSARRLAVQSAAW